MIRSRFILLRIKFENLTQPVANFCIITKNKRKGRLLKNQKSRERESNTLCLKGANLSLFNLFKNPKFYFHIPLLKGG